jgi:hypothetical protein
MVRFLEDPEQYKSCEMIERIDSSIQRYAAGNLFKFLSLLEMRRVHDIFHKSMSLRSLSFLYCPNLDF